LFHGVVFDKEVNVFALVDSFDDLEVGFFDFFNARGEGVGVVGPAEPDGVVFLPFGRHKVP
jgi:hypothetical protein